MFKRVPSFVFLAQFADFMIYGIMIIFSLSPAHLAAFVFHERSEKMHAKWQRLVFGWCRLLGKQNRTWEANS